MSHSLQMFLLRRQRGNVRSRHTDSFNMAAVGATHCSAEDYLGFVLFGLVATAICTVWVNIGYNRGCTCTGGGERQVRWP